MQRTQAWERRWSWMGGTLHWLFFVPLAQRQFWDPVNWTLGLGALLTVALGLAIGAHSLAKRVRSGRGGVSAYRGLLRVHHIGGLSVGLLLFIQVTSGWLSVDHGRIFALEDIPAPRRKAFQGGSLAQIGRAITTANLAVAAPASRLRLTGLNGRTVLCAEGAGLAARTFLFTSVGPQRVKRLPANLIAAAARKAWPEDKLAGAPMAARADDVHVLSLATNKYQGGKVAG